MSRKIKFCDIPDHKSSYQYLDGECTSCLDLENSCTHVCKRCNEEWYEEDDVEVLLCDECKELLSNLRTDLELLKEHPDI